MRGIVFVAQGEPARQQTCAAVAALRRAHVDLPVVVIGAQPMANLRHVFCADVDAGGRWAKVNLDILSPFDDTLYMDADTRALSGDIMLGFDMLADGWQLVIVTSENQGERLLWHVGEEEREQTFSEFGTRDLLQLQGGVFWFRKCQPVCDMFAAWRYEWARYRGQDQAALLRALRAAPVSMALLGRDFNSANGRVVKHLFGWARR